MEWDQVTPAAVATITSTSTNTAHTYTRKCVNGCSGQGLFLMGPDAGDEIRVRCSQSKCC